LARLRCLNQKWHRSQLRRCSLPLQ
jgi:hypothetical protein